MTSLPLSPHDPQLSEQLDYYEQRAPEYDDWFFRRGRYDRGEEANSSWFRDVALVRDQLGTIEWADCSVLEMAPGTGLWTQWLVDHGARVHAVDGSPAMLDQLRTNLGDRVDDVSTECADLFDWTPDATYDAVFFGFWLSHVPRNRHAAWWSTVASSLRPGGAVAFVDSRRVATSTANDHVLPESGELLTRRLDDGREFEIVKNFYVADDVVPAASDAGISLRVTTTPTYFVVGRGQRL